MTALQMLTCWGGVALICLAGIVVAFMVILRAREHAPERAREVGAAGASTKLGSAPTTGA